MTVSWLVSSWDHERRWDEIANCRALAICVRACGIALSASGLCTLGRETASTNADSWHEMAMQHVSRRNALSSVPMT